jgi:hypothetical protein
MHTGIDHMVLGIDDLDRGIAWVEQRTGVRAAFGGVHPGRGTRNALLALGPDCYLEIIAPDPQQSSPTWFRQILTMPEPRLIAWAVHTSGLAALAQNAISAGIPIDGPHDGSRSRQDGKMLSWKLFRLRDDRGGLFPFFIEWGRDAVHPAADAPPGCTLASFHLQSPDAQSLALACQTLGVDVRVESSEEPALFARIASPRGQIELTSR